MTGDERALSALVGDIDGAREADQHAGRPASLVLKKPLHAPDEFATYILNSATSIANYGERYRNGERISTGLTESAVNQVIAKRFVKK